MHSSLTSLDTFWSRKCGAFPPRINSIPFKIHSCNAFLSWMNSDVYVK